MSKRKTPKIESLHPILYKSIFQASYKPQLDFYEYVYSAASKIEGFPHWRTDGLRITLFNPKTHCSVAVAVGSFSYTQDSHDAKQDAKQIQYILQSLPQNLKIDNFVRFGLRRWYLIPVNFDFESLVNILSLKLLSQNEEFQSIFPKSFDDLSYTSITSEDSFKVRTTVEPTRASEIPRLIPIDQENHFTNNVKAYVNFMDSYPKVAIYVEVDFFRQEEGMSLEDAKNFANTSEQKVKEIVNNLCNYFLSNKTE
jgi:hypothetical protein